MFSDGPLYSMLPDKPETMSPLMGESPNAFSPGMSPLWMTISPQQLEQPMPPSGALSNFSTPSSEFDTSPAFYAENEFPGSTIASMPLFGPEDNPFAPMMERDLSTSSMSKNSSPTIDKIQAGRVQKKRVKKTDLPPIQFDVNDPKECKRAKNTAAARKSRAKKTEYIESLEAKIAEDDEKIRMLEEALAARDAEIASLKAGFSFEM